MTTGTELSADTGNQKSNTLSDENYGNLGSFIDAIKNKVAGLRHGELGSLPVIIALLAVWGYFVVSDPVFLSSRNISNLLLQTSVVAVLALGVTIVLLLAEIDLSNAAVAGVGAAVVAQQLQATSLPVLIVVLIGIAIGIGFGVVQGFFVAVLRVPSFVVTLSGLLTLQGVMLLILGKNGAINIDNSDILNLSTMFLPPLMSFALAIVALGWYAFSRLRKNYLRRSVGLTAKSNTSLVIRIVIVAVLILLLVEILNSYAGVPLITVIVLGLTGILTWLLSGTKYGRYIYAIGGNPEAARRAGINLVWIRVSAFALLGAIATFGGVLAASRYASVSFNAFAGGNLLLEAIAAAVIGGTSLFGGRGRAANALLGALVMGSLSNGLDLLGATSAVKFILSGSILLAAVTIDALARRGRESRSR